MKRFDVKNADGLVDLSVEIRTLDGPPKITKRLNDDQVAELELDAKEVAGLAVVLFGLVEVREQAARASAPPPAAPAPFAFAPKVCVHCGQLVAAGGVEQPGGGIAHRSCAADPAAAAATKAPKKGGRHAHSR